MNKVLITALLVVLASCGSTGDQSQHDGEHAHHAENTGQPQATENAPKPKSPPMSAMATIGENHVHIDYHSPSKRGRQIFGGLVAYGEVWVTGAHNATSIQFSSDVVIGGQEIAAGKYALFTIPGETEWTVIINKNWDQHLADEYDQSEDVVRVSVTPQHVNETVESLTYSVSSEQENEGNISISWDNVAIHFSVKNA